MILSAWGRTTTSCVLSLFSPAIYHDRSECETRGFGRVIRGQSFGGSASKNLNTIRDLSYLLDITSKYAHHLDSVTVLRPLSSSSRIGIEISDQRGLSGCTTEPLESKSKLAALLPRSTLAVSSLPRFSFLSGAVRWRRSHGADGWIPRPLAQRDAAGCFTGSHKPAVGWGTTYAAAAHVV